MTITTYTFDTPGSVTHWVVPYHTAGSLSIEVVGGDGNVPSGSSPGVSGGNPGGVKATVTLAAGTGLDLYVGAPGRANGAATAPSAYSGGKGAASGGAGSAVELSSSGAPIMVAGGGGGAGGGAFGSGKSGGSGGAGVSAGSPSSPPGPDRFSGQSGQGGTLSAAGFGGTAAYDSPGGPSYDGGAGSGHHGGDAGSMGNGGGGGGGYYGGGAGGSGFGSQGGGGGGGSTWVDTTVCSGVVGVAISGWRGSYTGLVKVTLDYLGDWVDRRNGWAVGRLAW